MADKIIAIAGAGLAGAVLARQLAEQGGCRVVVFEERGHIAGNCHTERDRGSGIMIHKYGPHIFHTDREDIWAWMKRFTDFFPYTNRVKAVTSRGVFSLPVNLLTINQIFGKTMDPREAQAFIRNESDPTIRDPKNFEEQALATIGRTLYETFFRDYTLKQWGIDPKQLPASILKRLPVRFTYDDNYYTSRFQGMPAEGYTKAVERMLDHPLIELKTGEKFDPGCAADFQHVFFTGTIDSFFSHRAGRLRYRTLEFHEVRDSGDYQGNPVINYCTPAVPWTRITEHKHFAPWEQHAQTVCFREISKSAAPGDVPYYPLRLDADKALLLKYMQLADGLPNVTFSGRLGTYRYLDMHVVIAEAIETAAAYLRAEAAGIRLPAFVHSPLDGSVITVSDGKKLPA